MRAKTLPEDVDPLDITGDELQVHDEEGQATFSLHVESECELEFPSFEDRRSDSSTSSDSYNDRDLNDDLAKWATDPDITHTAVNDVQKLLGKTPRVAKVFPNSFPNKRLICEEVDLVCVQAYQTNFPPKCVCIYQTGGTGQC